MYHNSIKLQSFFQILLNDQTVLFPSIQFSINHLFMHSLNVKQFYMTHVLGPIRCYHSMREWTWEHWQWRGSQYSWKLQCYWSLIIRLFCVIYRTLVGRGSYLSAEMQSVYSTTPVVWDPYNRGGPLGYSGKMRTNTLLKIMNHIILWTIEPLLFICKNGLDNSNIDMPVNKQSKLYNIAKIHISSRNN